MLRGTVFTDRGVYRLGEEVHLKADPASQHATAGIRLLPGGTPVLITVRDSQNRLVDERMVKLTPWSSAEWTMTLPQDGALGNYSLRAILESDRPKPKTPEDRRPGCDAEPGGTGRVRSVREGPFTARSSSPRIGGPTFVWMSRLTGDNAIAGDPLKGVVTARYLFGASMGARPVTWRYSKSPWLRRPRAITEKFRRRPLGVCRLATTRQPRESGEIRPRRERS